MGTLRSRSWLPGLGSFARGSAAVAYDPRIRASDADRDRAATLLREHHAAGRLTAEEFSERLDKVFEAKTIGELDALLADLPRIDPYRLPEATLTRQPRQSQLNQANQLAAAQGRLSPAWRAAWGSWFTCSLLCFVIWAIAGLGYPWPLWVAGPWGAILVARFVTGSHPSGSRGVGPGRGVGPVGPGANEPGQISSATGTTGYHDLGEAGPAQARPGQGGVWGNQDESGFPPESQ